MLKRTVSLRWLFRVAPIWRFCVHFLSIFRDMYCWCSRQSSHRDGCFQYSQPLLGCGIFKYKFSISLLKHVLLVLKRTVSSRWLFRVPATFALGVDILAIAHLKMYITYPKSLSLRNIRSPFTNLPSNPDHGRVIYLLHVLSGTCFGRIIDYLTGHSK